VNKGPSKAAKGRTTVARPFYEPGIREVIAEGDLAKMKRCYSQASTLLRQQGDLKAALKRLDKAIRDRERSQ